MPKESRKIADIFIVGGKENYKIHDHQADPQKKLCDKNNVAEELEKITEKLNELQEKLYAEAKKAVLIVFQAMDTGGKDGVVRKVFGPLNPQGVIVNSFKRPTPIELAHDFLWRIHNLVPAKGMIGIFNRSHYEDILVPYVHKTIDKEIIEERYQQVNDFEKYLAQNGVLILKFFLQISKSEQKKRLEERLGNKEKHWKFEMGDLAEREFWDQYQKAYENIINKCSTKWSRWYAIPADKKWYRDWIVGNIIYEKISELNPKYPKSKENFDNVIVCD